MEITFVIGEHTRKCPRCHNEDVELMDAFYTERNGERHAIKACQTCKAVFKVGKIAKDEGK